ncbi:Pse1 protein [Martiniozyma asiatica (nom. inval.)]|nr:Pse1 protein [Martiniozyma asiatica]
MSNIPQDIQQALGQLLAALGSPDNSTRKHAEDTLYKDWFTAQNVDVLLVFLAEQASSSQDQGIQAFAAVLFRRFALRSPNQQGYSVTARQIDHISDPAKIEIRRILLEGFTAQQTNNVRHKLADAIAEVAKDESSQWNELLPTIMQATTNADPSFRESSFRIISTTPQIISNHDLNESFLQMFHLGFEDENDDVRIATSTAFVAFFEHLPKSTWNTLAQLLPNLLNSLPRLLDSGNESALASVLQSLVELVELAPKIFKPMFETIISFCSNVAQNKELESNARLTALELLTSFCESSPTMCKIEPSYASSIVVTTLQLMTEVCIDDDEAAEWNNSDDVADEEEEEEYNAARQTLDRVSLKLGGQSMAVPLFNYLPNMLQSSSWREIQAALMAISSATEGCVDVLSNEIPKLLDMIIPTLQYHHPRVQYAGCNALGQISTDFAPHIQNSSGDRILPALISMLTTRNVPRVQAHAAAALVNFCEEATKDILEPYLDDLLSNLLTLLQSAPKRYVQEQVITTIAIVADAAENKFIKYYDTLMPLLIQVMQTDFGKENRLLKAKSIECATLVAQAVGAEKFTQNAEQILQIFTQLQVEAQEEDDPVRSYLEQGWNRVCTLIGKSFLPFLPSVLPPLLEQAKATQDISFIEEDDLEEINQNEAYEVIDIAGKHLAVHTSILDDKATAIELLKSYCETLGTDFYPYVNQIANEIVIPGLDFYLHDGVRGTCAVAMPILLKCCIKATGSSQSTEAFTLWKSMADKLIFQVGNDPASELFVAYYYALSTGLNLMGPNALNDSQIQNIGKSLQSNLNDIYERIQDRYSNENEYIEEIDTLDDGYTDEELLVEISSGLKIIFDNNKTRFLPAFLPLTSAIQSFIHDENTGLKKFALESISSLLEFAGEAATQLPDPNILSLFLNEIGSSLLSSDSSIRESAANCVLQAAINGGSSLSGFCIACTPGLTQMSSIPDAKAPDNLAATEAMCGALAAVLSTSGSDIAQQQGNDTINELINTWIKLLPVLQNESAAKYSYLFLAQLCQQNHPSVTGDLNKLSQTVENVVQALMFGAITENEIAKGVVQSVKGLLSGLSNQDQMNILGRLNAEQKAVFANWFNL